MGEFFWTVQAGTLPEGVQAVTDYTRATVVVDLGLHPHARRSALAHELEHVRRGPAPDDPVLAAREEHLVELAAARRLIPIADLVAAAAAHRTVVAAADELGVDPALLRVRMAHLDAGEAVAVAEAGGHHTDQA